MNQYYSFIKKGIMIDDGFKLINLTYFKCNVVGQTSFFGLTLRNHKVINVIKLLEDYYDSKKDIITLTVIDYKIFKNIDNYYTKEYIIHCEKMELERNIKQVNENQKNNKKVVKI